MSEIYVSCHILKRIQEFPLCTIRLVVSLECWDTGLMPGGAQWVKDAVGCNCSSDLIPGLGTPYDPGQPKRGKKKKKRKQKTQNISAESKGWEAKDISHILFKWLMGSWVLLSINYLKNLKKFLFTIIIFWGGQTCSMWKFPDQGLNLHCSCNLYHTRSNSGSLTCCPARELP